MDATAQLKGYSFTEKLYEGSRTVVYRGFCSDEGASSCDRLTEKSVQRPVVVKFLKDKFPSYSELMQFSNQYSVAKTLDLPSVVKPIALVPYGNASALVMDDFGGQDLKVFLQPEGGNAEKISLPLGESTPRLILFFQIAIQVTEALSGLCLARIIHKDIKPANILIHPESKQVKLIDFSIASALPHEMQEIQTLDVLEGTLAYLSPEQTGRMNRGIDYRSDFYSFGVTCYELLTGQLPFTSDEPMEIVHGHLARAPISPYELSGGSVPEVVAEIVLKLMAKNAEDRYQSAFGLRHDLERCLTQLKAAGSIEPFALGEKDVSDRFLLSEKRYGRQSEVAHLLAAFDRARSGSTELMLISGASGMGKTAVAREVHQPIARQGGYFIQGQYEQASQNTPLSAVIQALKGLVRLLLSESDAQLQSWRSHILDALGEETQSIVDILPELESIVGLQASKTERSTHGQSLIGKTAAENNTNLLIQKFVEVFTRSQHPLTLFLDNLQWIDAASLNLLQLWMKDDGHLLVIGAYRTHEVPPHHPLLLTLEAIHTARANTDKKPNINTLALSYLSEQDVKHFVADTLHSTLETAQPLAKLVYEKTSGNPFFIAQYLISLQADQKITFNAADRQWQYTISAINTTLATDDVLELISMRLQQLPAGTQSILQTAAYLGVQFDLETVTIATQLSLETVSTHLWCALQEGLVVPTCETYKAFTPYDTAALEQANPTYRFFHDNIQQAAYNLIEPRKRADMHRTIGLRLLRHTEKKQQDNLDQSTQQINRRLLDIVSHLNQGITLIETAAERDRLVKLNLSAGQCARVTYAYDTALECLTTGLSLLPKDQWKSYYALTIALHKEAAEVAYLQGSLVRMQAHIEAILDNASTILDKACAYEIQIQATVSQNYFLQSVETTLQVLEQLGEPMGREPQPEDVQTALEAIAQQIQQQPVATLIDLPEMTDAASLVIMRLLSKVVSAAYIARPELLPLLICAGIKRCLQFGNSPLSAFLYAWYGVLLCAHPQSAEQGYDMGQLALKLLEKMPAGEIKTRVVAIVYFLVHPWKASIRASLQPLAENYRSGLLNGDSEYAAWSLCNHCYHAFLSGEGLKRLRSQIRRDCQRVSQIQQTAAGNYLSLHQQTVLNLLGHSATPVLIEGEAYSEATMLPTHLATNDMTGLALLHIHKGMLAYLFAKPRKAEESFGEARQYLQALSSSQWLPAVCFYDALSCLAVLEANDLDGDSPKEGLRQRLEANQTQLKDWAALAPENQLHRWHLVEAERSRVENRKADAIDHYDQAIALAAANRFVHEEALAHELAAQFYLKWGKGRIAQSHMIDAYYAYSRWGAGAKVLDLETRYPKLLESALTKQQQNLSSTDTILAYASTQSTTTHGSSTSEVIDLATLLKTSQILSSEIELEKLLAALLKAVIQNAGADKCALMLPKEEQPSAHKSEDVWVIEAFSELGKPPEFLQSTPIKTGELLSTALINQVKHTQEPAVIFNAAVHPSLAADPYVLRRQPKSILCVPILKQSKLIAILYLENNLTIGAFTDRRVEVLNLICTQAAISLENARLYRQAQTSLEELQTSHMQLVQSEKMSALGNLVAGVAHEINNPVNFLKGNLKPALNYIKDILGVLDMVVEDEPRADILDEMEDINVEFIREDLPNLLNSMAFGISRIHDISNSLRTFSRADKDYKTAFDVHAGLDSTLLILKHRLQPKDARPPIEVRKEYGDLPDIHCFAGQLNQVFMNLIANAIEAIHEASEHWTVAEATKKSPSAITITTSQVDLDRVKIAIADTGPGIAPDIQTRIFDHLFTTKPVGKGTGLGLAISHTIVVEKHGGTLTVSSEVEKGTEFVIILPVKKSAEK